MAQAKPAVSASGYRPPLHKVLLSIPEIGVVVAVVVFFVAFTLADKSMASPENLQRMALQGSMVGLAAFGMSYLIIVGEIDLSAGVTAGLAAAIFGLCRANLHWPEVMCVLAALVVAALVGLLNSFVVLKVKMPSFFATLGSNFLVLGLTTWLLQGAWIYIGDIIPGLSTLVKPSPIFGLPWVFVFLLPAYVVGDLLIRFSKIGPILTATGGNRQAAEIVGINVPLVKALCFVFVSVCAGMAGLVTGAYGGTTDTALGSDWMLWIIAIAIIGGGSLRGGVGSIIGALLGAALVSTIRLGMANARVYSNAQGIVIGAVLIGAAILDVIRRRTAQY